MLNQRIRLPFILLLFGAIVFLAPVPAAAQDAAEKDRTFEGSSNVLLVEVPVNVTDRRGEPIRGLTAADFEIFDDGEKQEIESFEVVDLDVIQPATDLEVERVAEELPPAARRHFMLLFDLSFSTPVSVVKAREAARDFVLNSLHPTDLVSVATYSLSTGPRLVITFTPDRAQLARAIDTLGAQRLLGARAERDPLQFVIDSFDNLTTGFSGQSDESTTVRQDLQADNNAALLGHLTVVGKQLERGQKAFERSRILAMSRSMGELARALDSVQGRKHVVYFSEGFDSRLLLGRSSSLGDTGETETEGVSAMFGDFFMVDTDDRHGNSSLQQAVGSMLDEFKRADCVIQAVDIGGLRAGAGVGGSRNNRGQEALFYMANATGGQLFEDANDLDRQLSKVLARSSVTYLVAFRPKTLEWNGEYHRLKVRLEKDVERGVRLSHRSGYYAPRPFEELHPLEKSLMASDAIAKADVRRDLDLNVMAVPFRATPQRAYVPVIVEIDGADLLIGHDGDSMPIEIYAYVTNDKGEMKDFFTQVIGLDISGGRSGLESTGVKYYGHLDLPAGRHLVRVLVRNAKTGRTGVTTAAVDVPSYDDAEPFLLPPFFLEPPGRWVLVREKQDDSYRRSVVYPFTLKGEPFIPSVQPNLDNGDQAEVCLVGYNLLPGALQVDGQVLDSDGGSVGTEAKLAFLERTVTGIDGVDKLHARFEPHGLDAGDYTLRVSVTDPGGRTQINSIPFTVRNH